MAYCGILDGLMEIDGKPVDLSRLNEGIIVAGDEEFDADDWISDEDKLNFFNETALRTKEALIKEIDSLLKKIDDESKTDNGHSPVFYEKYKALVISFREEVERNAFPEKLENWWRYEYEVRESGITLSVSHIDYLSISSNDCVDENKDTTFDLLNIRAKLLTAEQYAQIYGVTTTTVRQWIRRGKIRTAMKVGSEWRIPELAEIMTRGYRWGRYYRKEVLTDLPEAYAFFNDYDFVMIGQNSDRKDLFDVTIGKKHDYLGWESEEEMIRQNYKDIQMDQKEREKFELYLISNPFIEPEEACLASREY